MDNDVTPTGKQLIERWQQAQERLKRAKSEENSASVALSNATDKLGAWLCPDDAKYGETFCVWYGDALISTTKLCNGSYKIEVRNSGKRARL